MNTTQFLRHILMVSMIAVMSCTASGLAMAQEMQYNVTKGEYKHKDSEKTVVFGKIVSIAHTLQHRAGGADAQDSLFSKGRQGLLTSGGTLWTFVDNIKGQDLQWNKDYLGKFIKIDGWVFHDAQYIEVSSFSIEGTEYAWSETTNSFKPENASVATVSKTSGTAPKR